MERGYIKIKPFGGLFFGKGRPFNMGDETWTEAELLPPPGVVWGVLASQLYYTNGHIPPKPEKFKIGPPMLLGRDNTFSSLCLPAPLDIFISPDEEKYHHTFDWQRENTEDKKETPGFINHQNARVLLAPHTLQEVESPEKQLIAWGDLFEGYISETSKVSFNFSLKSIDQAIATEFKIGIGRDPATRTAEESKLFTVQLSHLIEDGAILVEYKNQTGSSLPKNGLVKMGGEGKMAAYEQMPEKSVLVQEIEKRKAAWESDKGTHDFFKAVALMPLPLNENGLPIALQHSGFEILGGVTGKPAGIGGFDYKERRPKPLKQYAPAGSVWVLWAKSGSYTAADVHSQLKKLNEEGDIVNPFMNAFQIFPYHFIKKT